MNTTIPTESRQAAMLHALQARRFFKLIGGGSLTNAEKLVAVCRAYTLAGADCLDVAPDPAVVEAIDGMLNALPVPHPVLMVSVPLDPDPHFRKIELADPACIRCGACLPVCPTEAITLPDALQIAQELCYGCGRCLPACPTDALSLLPFQVDSHLHAALSHPRVQAVEIHSRYADPYMLEAFWRRWGTLLADKLIALCFRPTDLTADQWLAFYDTAVRLSPHPVILQIDGAPMSGTDHPDASRPALEAAGQVAAVFRGRGLPQPAITISGGINRHTARYLQEPDYAFIAGVGMGTVARQAVWSHDPETARRAAEAMVGLFQLGVGGAIRYNK